MHLHRRVVGSSRGTVLDYPAPGPRIGVRTCLKVSRAAPARMRTRINNANRTSMAYPIWSRVASTPNTRSVVGGSFGFSGTRSHRGR